MCLEQAWLGKRRRFEIAILFVISLHGATGGSTAVWRFYGVHFIEIPRIVKIYYRFRVYGEENTGSRFVLFYSISLISLRFAALVVQPLMIFYSFYAQWT
jgi:hypothetical protein